MELALVELVVEVLLGVELVVELPLVEVVVELLLVVELVVELLLVVELVVELPLVMRLVGWNVRPLVAEPLLSEAPFVNIVGSPIVVDPSLIVEPWFFVKVNRPSPIIITAILYNQKDK